jgi:hypothetical protein
MTTRTAQILDHCLHTAAALDCPATATEQNVSLAVIGERSPERNQLEQAIARKFQSTFGAQIMQFLPYLLRLKISDELGAVVGVRAARNDTLFLEQYIDRPVEQIAAQAYATPIDRDQVVEIGNLAADLQGTSYVLFAVLATVLNQAGFRWVTCTATPQVEAMLTKMRFSYRTIGSADATRLDDDSADWGAYYDSRPSVIVGDLRDATRRIMSNPKTSALVRQFARPIIKMAADIGVAKS